MATDCVLSWKHGEEKIQIPYSNLRAGMRAYRVALNFQNEFGTLTEVKLDW